MVKKTKGQAALEFLTTYGWAFLVILVMIGALSYFGVLNPRALLPEKCLLPQEFSCQDYRLQISSNDLNVNFYVQNNKGSSIDFNITSFESPDFDSKIDCPGTGCTGTYNLTLSPNEQGEIAATISGVANNLPEIGDKAKIKLKGTYKEKGGKYWHNFEGEIFATLQE